ncbi:MAG: hypothetical protein JWL62_2929 [Hyphomicrobiales bacterium]|nr:hypothetical protein [Hyphomicrobiales bacterium]
MSARLRQASVGVLALERPNLARTPTPRRRGSVKPSEVRLSLSEIAAEVATRGDPPGLLRSRGVPAGPPQMSQWLQSSLTQSNVHARLDCLQAIVANDRVRCR